MQFKLCMQIAHLLKLGSNKLICNVCFLMGISSTQPQLRSFLPKMEFDAFIPTENLLHTQSLITGRNYSNKVPTVSHFCN